MAEEKHGSVTINRAKPAPASGAYEPWAGVFGQRKDSDMDKAPEIKMQALKTHLGAAGGQVRAGSPYTLQSERTAAEHVRLGIGERLSPEAPTEEEAAAAGETDDLAKPWLLSKTPEEYLKQWPDGKHAAHAQAVIDRGEGGQ